MKHSVYFLAIPLLLLWPGMLGAASISLCSASIGTAGPGGSSLVKNDSGTTSCEASGANFQINPAYTGLGNATAFAQVGLGTLHAFATSSGETGLSEAFSLSTSATAFYQDIFTVSQLTVPSARLNFNVFAGGSLLAADAAGPLTSGDQDLVATASDTVSASLNGALDSTQGAITDCVRDISFLSVCNGSLPNPPTNNEAVGRTIPLWVTVRNGDRVALQMTLTVGTITTAEQGETANATADLSRAVFWGGLVSAEVTGGGVYDGPVVLTSQSGFDYTQSAGAPEPATWLTSLAALLLMLMLVKGTTGDTRVRSHSNAFDLNRPARPSSH